MSDPQQPPERRRLISHSHRKRSLTAGLVALAVIIAIIVLLPRVVALLVK